MTELEGLLGKFAEASRERLANAPEGCDCSACGDYRAARQSVIRWVAERTITPKDALDILDLGTPPKWVIEKLERISSDNS